MTSQTSHLRESLSRLLKGEGAHLAFDEVIAGIPAKQRGVKPKGAPHSAWELLEHLRIAQADIIEFTVGDNYMELEFPGGYWPATEAPPDEKAWDASVAAFRKDLKRMLSVIEDERSDLFASIERKPGASIYSQSMMLADHNSYHLGQLVMLKRMLQE